MSDEMTLEERKVIYRARRGLKEIDVYFDPYVKNYYLNADPAEKALFAELVEQEDVNIQTPQGDVDMQETVEEDMPSDQLSYEELRSRLPVEITDDIVRLLVSSAAALGDFAQIQTQQDVDNFNAKYGVNLVLPSEA